MSVSVHTALYIIWLQVSSCNPALIFCKNLFMKSNACERAKATATAIERDRVTKIQQGAVEREAGGGSGTDSHRYLLHSL